MYEFCGRDLTVISLDSLIISVSWLKKYKKEEIEMPPWLRPHAASAEEGSLVPTTHTRQFITAYNFSSRNSTRTYKLAHTH